MHEVFDHTADIGLRIRAATLEELFLEAAIGIFSLIVTNLDEVQPREKTEFELPLRDKQYDYLLFDWLSELLYTFDTRRLLLSKFEIVLSPEKLQATAWGEKLDPARHAIDHEVKAITYHGLRLAQEPSGWLAEVIVDI
jgi:protein archease